MAKKIDWEAVEKEYRAGIRTLREIANDHGTTHTTIRRRAKDGGWTQNLTTKIHAKAAAIVERSKAREKCSTGTTGISDKDIIESNAQDIAAIDLSHRADVQRLRRLSSSLMEELELQTTNNEVLTLVTEQGQDEGAVSSAQARAIKHLLSCSGRIDSIKKLTETMKIQVELERKIVKLDAALPEGDESQNIVIDFSTPLIEDDNWGNEGGNDEI